MAECLIEIATGKVLCVVPDGHQWGIRESRAAYDEHVMTHGQPTRTAVDVVTARTRKITDIVRGTVSIPAQLYKPETARQITTPPPDRMGVLRVDGDIETVETVTQIDIDAQMRTALLAGTVSLSLHEWAKLGVRDGD